MKVTLEIKNSPITPNQVREAVVMVLHHRGMRMSEALECVKIVGVLLEVPLIKVDEEDEKK